MSRSMFKLWNRVLRLDDPSDRQNRRLQLACLRIFQRSMDSCQWYFAEIFRCFFVTVDEQLVSSVFPECGSWYTSKFHERHCNQFLYDLVHQCKWKWTSKKAQSPRISSDFGLATRNGNMKLWLQTTKWTELRIIYLLFSKDIGPYWFAKTKSIKKTSYCEKYLSNAEIQDCQVRTATEAANFVPVCQEAVCGQHSFCVHHPWSTVDDELMFWNMVMWIQNKVKNGFSDYTVMTNIVMIFLSVANLTIPWPF